jgi:DNA-binding NtrC family response regulator
VCATNRDLDAEMDGHGFRRDLYYRIAANVVRLPPLGERRDDVLPLFRHFLSGAMPGAVSLDDAVVRWIQQRDYPGNVRDLKQLAARIAARHVGPGPVTPGDVPEEERPRPSDVHTGRRQLLERAVQAALDDERTLKEIKEEAADTAIRLTIADCRTRRAAARRLGVTERALQLRRKRETSNRSGEQEGNSAPQDGSSSSRG